MNALRAAPLPAPSLSSVAGDEERSLLIRLELLLERENEQLASGDVTGLVDIAAERERVTEQLLAVAQRRPSDPDRQDRELVALYQRLRRLHDVQAQVVRRHAERNARAIGVLAQATGQAPLYRADGQVAMQFAAL